MSSSLAKLDDLVTPVSETFKFEPGQKVIFLNTSDIESGKFLHTVYSEAAQLPGQAKKKIKKDDILFSEIRPANRRYAYVDIPNTKDYVVSTKLMVLRAKEGVFPKFVYHWITSNEQLKQLQVIAESRSGTFPQITFDTIKHLTLNKLDYETQEKTSNFIDAIDKKVELNRRMNDTLEQIGQALFKKYFVDNPESEHWESVSLERIADVQYGFAFKSSAFNEKGEGKKIVRIRNVLEGDSNSYTTETATDNYVVNNGDLLVGMDGEFHIGYWTGGEAYLVQRVANFKAKDKFSNSFVKYVIGDPIHKLNKRGARTTVAHLSAKDIREIMFPFSDEEYGPLSEVFAVINRQQIHLLTQNRTLAELRDSILPKLMSGDISV